MGCAFASGGTAVMANGTGPDHLRVIYADDRLPGRGVMTGFADGAGLNMAGGFAAGQYAIVASRAGFAA